MPAPEAKRVIGGFTLLKPLAEGGVGSVHKARHRSGGEAVVIKLLHPHVAENQGFVERFRREAELGMRIHHRHVVQTLAFGTDDGVPYMAQEYLSGMAFDQVLDRKGPLPLAVALGIAATVADGLGHMHSLGIVHRDVKPGNVFLTRGGRAVLVDLGLAKPLDWDDIQVDQPPVEHAVSWTVSGAGGVMGTPAYMAPEQATDPAHVRPAADVHALGVMLFLWLSGGYPRLPSSDMVNGVARLINQPPTSLAAHAPELPGPVIDLVDRMVTVDPALRPADGDAAAAAIRALIQELEAEPTQTGSVRRGFAASLKAWLTGTR